MVAGIFLLIWSRKFQVLVDILLFMVTFAACKVGSTHVVGAVPVVVAL